MVLILSILHPASHMDANGIKLIRNLIMTDGTQLFCCWLFGVNKILHDIVLYLIIPQGTGEASRDCYWSQKTS